jgi:hypothetical protein
VSLIFEFPWKNICCAKVPRKLENSFWKYSDD